MNQNTGKDEIKEFMTGAENKRKRQNRKKRRRSSEQYTVAVAGLILMAVIFVVVGIFACGVPVVPVCILALLEVILARCFYDLPIFVHLLIVAAQIIAETVEDLRPVLLHDGVWYVDYVRIRFKVRKL